MWTIGYSRCHLCLLLTIVLIQDMTDLWLEFLVTPKPHLYRLNTNYLPPFQLFFPKWKALNKRIHGLLWCEYNELGWWYLFTLTLYKYIHTGYLSVALRPWKLCYVHSTIIYESEKLPQDATWIARFSTQYCVQLLLLYLCPFLHMLKATTDFIYLPEFHDAIEYHVNKTTKIERGNK